MRRAVTGLLLACAALVGCGESTTRVEPTVNVAASAARPSGPAAPSDDPGGGVRISVVTHGQAASPFWAIVRNGVEAAARQSDVVVTYRAPDVYSLDKMVAMIDEAVASRPDGLVVSLPEPGLRPAIRRAVAAGLPVVTINSGSDTYRSLGVLAHVGQPEGRAGLGAGRRLVALGVRRALCVNHVIVNQGLDERCEGLSRAMRAAGGRSFSVRIDDQSPNAARDIVRAVQRTRADGVLGMNSQGGLAAVKGLADRPEVLIATFDLGPDILRAVKAGRIHFAVDQQAYLQGFLPVMLLAERARHGIFPAQGDVIPTGPNFVTRENADLALDLSERSIR